MLVNRIHIGLEEMQELEAQVGGTHIVGYHSRVIMLAANGKESSEFSDFF